MLYKKKELKNKHTKKSAGKTMAENKRTVCILKENGGSHKSSRWIEVVLNFCFLTGTFLAVRDLGYSGACLWAGILTGLLVLLIRLAVSSSEKTTERVKWILYIAGIGCFVVGITFIVQGFLCTVDLFIQLWNLRFHTELPQMQISARAGLGAVLLWGLAGMVLSSFLIAQVQKKKLCGIFLTVISVLAFGYILGQSGMWMPTFFLLTGVTGLLVYYSAPWRKLVMRDGFCTLLVAGLVLVLVFSTGGYHQVAGIEKWKQDTVDAIDEFRYGKDTLPQGNLMKAQNLLSEKADRLKVTLEEPEELYLRGFVGGSYGGNRWSTLSSTAYEDDYAGMLTWLSEKGLTPVKQYGEYDKLAKEATGSYVSYQQVTVENKGAYRKYLYLPAQAESWSDAGNKEVKDWNVTATGFMGASSYNFKVAYGVPNADSILLGNWMEQASAENQTEYLNAESVYHSFVKDHYLDVENELEPVISQFFFQDETLDKEDFNQVTTAIRQQLRMNMDYTESPETVPSGEDYVKWFLEDQKSGNAVAFASAAVLAYREAGYPARYAEGYHLTATEAEDMISSGKTHITLTTQNAHAWVEVYVAGAGWLPVEVVPGFYVETYSDQIVEGRPAYKINSSTDDQGVGTEDQNGSGAGDEQTKDNTEKENNSRLMIPEALILVLYLLLIFYLLLEFQRFLRIQAGKRKIQKCTDPEEKLEIHLELAENLMKLAGVHGDYSHPMELWEEVNQKLPSVPRAEYDRIIKLLQKARFGGMKLKAYEYHTLELCSKNLCNAIYEGKNKKDRFILRYIWAVPRFPEE